MADISTRNLQARLLILVFLAFLPAMGIFAYATHEVRELQLQAKEQELVLRAQVTAARFRSMVTENGILLAGLAEFPEVRTGHPPACTDYLGRVLRHADQLTTISLIGMDGYMACGAFTPENPLYLGDRAYFVRATSRKPSRSGSSLWAGSPERPWWECAIPSWTGTTVNGRSWPPAWI